MCLSNISGGVRVAEKDIVCYKVVTKHVRKAFNDVIYLTPFKLCNVKFDTVLRKELNGKTLGQIIERCEKYGNYYGGLDASVFHCFSNPDDALQVAEEFNSIDGVHSVRRIVIEAVIPAGTEYVVGEFSVGFCNNAFYYPSIGTTAVIYKSPEGEEK